MDQAIDNRLHPELRGFLLALLLAAVGAAGVMVAGGAFAGAERDAAPPRQHQTGGSDHAQAPSTPKLVAPARAKAAPPSTAAPQSVTPASRGAGSPSGGGSARPSSPSTGSAPNQTSGPTAPEPTTPPPGPSNGGSHAADEAPVGGGQAAPLDALD